MISKILLIFTFLIRVKSENWWSKVTGYDTEDHNHGYAGASFRKAVDFYLCGKKNLECIMKEMINQHGQKIFQIVIR